MSHPADSIHLLLPLLDELHTLLQAAQILQAFLTRMFLQIQFKCLFTKFFFIKIIQPRGENNAS